jgi:hypothetical protein
MMAAGESEEWSMGHRCPGGDLGRGTRESGVAQPLAQNQRSQGVSAVQRTALREGLLALILPFGMAERSGVSQSPGMA